MASELDVFLREGVTRYVEATETLEYFQEKIADRLEAVLRHRRSWKQFSPLKGGEPFDSDIDDNPGDGKWVLATADGKLNDQVRAQIEIGIWWKAPEQKEPILLYARAWHRKDENYLDVDELKAPDTLVRAGEVLDCGYLLRPLPEGSSFEEIFEPLLVGIEDSLIRASQE